MWKKILTETLAILFITIVSLVSMRSFARPGLPMLHDSNPHISRMVAYHTALLDGQLPPMWAKEVLGGIGSPVLMLNYQLPYAISEIWVRLGMDYFDSYKLTLALSFLVSGLAMYAALRQKYKVLPALIGTLVYLLAPYRMVDIFVRGAYGESLSFIFPPLILLGYYRKSTAWLTIGWAGLFLTHPLASATFTLFFLGYSLFVTDAKEKKAMLQRHAIAFTIACLLAAFNLLPTLALTKETYYTPADSAPLSQFPTLMQLINSPWGYGVSKPGPADGMSFSVGYVQWAIILIAILYCLVRLIKKKHVSRDVVYVVSILIICLFFMLAPAAPLYRWLHLTLIVDFPWRLLLCVVFATGWLASFLCAQLPKRFLPVAAICISICLTYFIAPLQEPSPNYWHHDFQFFARETGDSYGEYASRYRATRDSAPFGLRAETIAGKAIVREEMNHSNDQRYTIVASAASLIRINTSYFRGWHVFLDDIALPVSTTQDAASKEAPCYVTTRTQVNIDDSGLIACHVTEGTHTLRIHYSVPSVQAIGNLISLVGSGVFLWYLCRSFYLHIMKAKLSSKT